MNKKNKILKDNDFDIIEFIKSIYSRKKSVIKTSTILLLLGIIYSFSIKNEYKSSITFFPHFQGLEENSDIKSLAGIAGINLSQQSSINTPTTLYPEIIKSLDFKNEILISKISSKNNLTYREYLSDLYLSENKFYEIILAPIKIFDNFFNYTNNKDKK